MIYVIIFLPPHYFIIQNKNSHIVLDWNACVRIPSCQRHKSPDRCSCGEAHISLLPLTRCLNPEVSVVGCWFEYIITPGMKYDAPSRMHREAGWILGSIDQSVRDCVEHQTKYLIWQCAKHANLSAFQLTTYRQSWFACTVCACCIRNTSV